MSRPQPPKLDGWSVPVSFVLTAEDVANIEGPCGVPLMASARVELEEALHWYLINTAAKAEAPTIGAAEKRLDKMHQLAVELRDLTCVQADGATENNLRFRLCADLDLPDNAASRLYVVLGDFLNALAPVRESLAHKREWPELDPPRQLASDLDIIWRFRLEQQRTISAAGDGSPFVRFVQAATGCLPSHWPWRPAGTRGCQSLEAFAKAIDRSLNHPLDG